MKPTFNGTTPLAATLAAVLIFVLTAIATLCAHRADESPTTTQLAPPITVPDFKIPLGHARRPLPYRIISFQHGGTGKDVKNLIKLAAQLGFNGVQFQIEGSNEQGLQDFADNDAKNHLVDYCHHLGMKVTVWIHEFSDLPGPWMPEYLGPNTAANERLWSFLDKRYDRILTSVIPNVDGLVLTVVETEVRATDPDVMLRLVKLLSQKCAAHHKSLIVRTFVWYPEEFQKVMDAVNKLPSGTIIMSKAVPQDWQMRGANAREIGAVGGRPQIEEFDACGEYFLKDTVANCMVDLLKRQFDYGLSKNIQGICVRVDRDDASVLWEPNEVNLWTLGLLAGGVTDKADDIWQMWARYRYGDAAAPGVIRALKPTADVVAELLSVGPFSFGDTRFFPPLPNDPDTLLMNWQNWRWDKSYLPAYYQAAEGDAAFIAQITRQKEAAAKLAAQSLADLEIVRPKLSNIEYKILYTKLLTNQAQLACRTPMILATLQYQAFLRTTSPARGQTLAADIRKNLQRIRDLADTLGDWPLEEDYRGKTWYIGEPENMDPEPLYHWAYNAERILEGYPVPPPILKLQGPQ